MIYCINTLKFINNYKYILKIMNNYTKNSKIICNYIKAL